ncbi:MAG: tetratricopeptide repeat protein [Planctomycetes bacterium]|nr:tetratricopeptide repeat protein [Planctomycetota bacterium]
MNSTTSTILVALCVVAAGAVATYTFLSPQSVQETRLDSGLKAELGELRQAIEDQNDAMAGLRQELSDLRARSNRSSGLGEAEVRRLVAAALEERPAAATAAMTGGAENGDHPEAEFNLERTLTEMISGDFDWDARQRYWAKIKEKGLYKEAIAWFKARAKNAPNDPEAQADYADACIALINSGQIGYVEMGPLSMQADAAWDRALELDDHHWRSRFSKAVSYTFWPDAMGKKPEAIRHFEILAEQQSQVAPEPRHAQTHLFLGNIYAQQGNMEKARASWEQGLKLDPNNEELKKQIAGSGGAGH